MTGLMTNNGPSASKNAHFIGKMPYFAPANTILCPARNAISYPAKHRGFSVNTVFFFSRTYNEIMPHAPLMLDVTKWNNRSIYIKSENKRFTHKKNHQSHFFAFRFSLFALNIPFSTLLYIIIYNIIIYNKSYLMTLFYFFVYANLQMVYLKRKAKSEKRKHNERIQRQGKIRGYAS